MHLNEDRVPATLDEAVTILVESLSSDDVLDIKNPKNDATHCHFTWGMLLRNEWTIWDKETKMVIWFKEHYGLDHADDISGLILECLWRDVNKQPRDIGNLVRKYYK